MKAYKGYCKDVISGKERRYRDIILNAKEWLDDKANFLLNIYKYDSIDMLKMPGGVFGMQAIRNKTNRRKVGNILFILVPIEIEG